MQIKTKQSTKQNIHMTSAVQNSEILARGMVLQYNKKKQKNYFD